MSRRSLLLLLPSLLAAEIILSETNYLILPDNGQSYDLNRLRFDYSLAQEAFALKTVIDNQTLVASARQTELARMAQSRLPFDPILAEDAGPGWVNRLLLSRLLVERRTERLALGAGVERLAWGVGKLWAPTDIINPKNPLALEPDEREGVAGGHLFYYPQPLASAELFGGWEKEGRFDLWAARCRHTTGELSWGLSAQREGRLQSSGLELEGALPSGTGIRAEAAWHHDGKRETGRAMVGADHAFANGLILTGELFTATGSLDGTAWLEQRGSYGGIIASWQATPLTLLSVTALSRLGSDTGGLFASLLFSFSDNGEIVAGAALNRATGEEGYGYLGIRYYFAPKL